MKLVATTARSLQTDMQAEMRAIERAVSAGTRDAGRGLKAGLRRQVSSAGLGQRLANSGRDRHYPNQKLDAASVVYTKAPQIIRAFDERAVIRRTKPCATSPGSRSSPGSAWIARTTPRAGAPSRRSASPVFVGR